MVGFISPMSDPNRWFPSAAGVFLELGHLWSQPSPALSCSGGSGRLLPLSKNGSSQPVQPAVSMVSFAIIYIYLYDIKYSNVVVFFEVSFQTDTQPTCQPADGKWGFPSWAGVQQHRAHASSCHADCTCTTWLPWTCSGLGPWAMQSWGCMKMG